MSPAINNARWCSSYRPDSLRPGAAVVNMIGTQSCDAIRGGVSTDDAQSNGSRTTSCAGTENGLVLEGLREELDVLHGQFCWDLFKKAQVCAIGRSKKEAITR